MLSSLNQGSNLSNGRPSDKVFHLKLMLPGEIQITAEIIDEIGAGVIARLEQLGRSQ